MCDSNHSCFVLVARASRSVINPRARNGESCRGLEFFRGFLFLCKVPGAYRASRSAFPRVLRFRKLPFPVARCTAHSLLSPGNGGLTTILISSEPKLHEEPEETSFAKVSPSKRDCSRERKLRAERCARARANRASFGYIADESADRPSSRYRPSSGTLARNRSPSP